MRRQVSSISAKFEMRGQVKLVVIQLSWRLEDKLVATISAKVEMSGQVYY
jgi:hypothetical protein